MKEHYYFDWSYSFKGEGNQSTMWVWYNWYSDNFNHYEDIVRKNKFWFNPLKSI